jgi:hypothetical protein
MWEEVLQVLFVVGGCDSCPGLLTVIFPSFRKFFPILFCEVCSDLTLFFCFCHMFSYFHGIGLSRSSYLTSDDNKNNILMSFSTKTRRPAVGPIQPPIYLVPGFYPEVERPGREANHSLPSPPICPRRMDRDNGR